MKKILFMTFFVFNALAQNPIDQYINARRVQIEEQTDKWAETFLPRMSNEQRTAMVAFLESAVYLPELEMQLHYGVIGLQNVASLVQAELSKGNQFNLSGYYDRLLQDMKEWATERNKWLDQRTQVMQGFSQDELFNDACQSLMQGTFEILRPLCAEAQDALGKDIMNMIDQEKSAIDAIEASREKLASIVKIKNNLPDPMWFIDESCGLINDMQQARADAIHVWSPAANYHCVMIIVGSAVVREYCRSLGEWLEANNPYN